MDALEALKLTREAWSENEEQYLKHYVGYQQKVESAAKEGRISCVVATLSSVTQTLIDFTASFFEQQGYYVNFQQVQTGEVSVILNWKNQPLGSRPWIESQELAKSLG